ncbi:hypothetical protein F2P79_019264, partial [Pimephales promelas]
ENITSIRDLETNACKDLVDTTVLGTVIGSDPREPDQSSTQTQQPASAPLTPTPVLSYEGERGAKLQSM